jgi:hypothetical protein
MSQTNLGIVRGVCSQSCMGLDDAHLADWDWQRVVTKQEGGTK